MAASEFDTDLGDFFTNAAIALHAVDRHGTILDANRAELALLGYARAEYVGRNIAEFHVDAGVSEDMLRRLAAGETLREHPARLRCKDGSTRDVRVTSNVLRDKGEFVHTRCITRDVTDERNARAGDEARAHLAAIVESSDDAIISKSLDGIVRSWNRGAERLFGYRATEVVGRSIALVIPEERLGEEHDFLTRLRAGEHIEHYETVRRRKDGRMVDVSLSISPIRDADGRIIGASKIARDITARRRADEAAREAARRKDEFLAMLAHELRNPLAPIRSSLDVLRLAAPDGRHAETAREIIGRQVGNMVRLVDDLLEVSRISRGKIDLVKEPVDLASVLASALETSGPAIEGARHKLSVSEPSEALVVNGDMVRLGQVVSNILNNAAKYTDPGGEIAVSLRREGDEAVLEVRDSGIGFEPGAQPRLFEMFAQVGGLGERTRGGLGIGLALAHKLVEMHGGRIEAVSEGPGKGALFSVRLPLVSAAPRAAANEAVTWSAPVARARRRVLVVDDNVDAAQALGMMLGTLGYDVQVAHDGRAALEAARSRRPDIALLDISMPGFDGNEVVRRLRKEPEFRAVRFIAITGLGRQDDIRRSTEAGFDEHLVKPVSPEVLRLALEG